MVLGQVGYREVIMDLVMDLTALKTDRIIIVGELLGEYNKLIGLLYQQKFCFNDTLIFTGNFIDTDTALEPTNEKQMNAITFIRNTINTYSVKGKNEFSFLRKIEESGDPQWLSNNSKRDEIVKFIDELPLIIKISDYIYIVNAGVQPNKPLTEQDPEVFYSISEYDPDSRFYQFENPSHKSWYDFDMYEGERLLKFCFGGSDLNQIEVPAGYCLGRTAGKQLKVLVFRKDYPNPIILQA
jgi:hypothetical protein